MAQAGMTGGGLGSEARDVLGRVAAGRQKIQGDYDEPGSASNGGIEGIGKGRSGQFHVGRKYRDVTVARQHRDLGSHQFQRRVRRRVTTSVIDDDQGDAGTVVAPRYHIGAGCQCRRAGASAAALHSRGGRLEGGMIFDLGGHVALVTGGNGGIGLGMARGLAKAGASIAVWGRNPAKNEAAVAELESLGAKAAAFVVDVTQESQVAAATGETLARFGRVDSCFANAGVGIAASITEMTIADWNAVVDINLVGAFLTFREVARHMITRGGGGKLVGIASIGSIHGMPRQAQYSASKAGLCALVRSLAVELARHGIQANSILPGWIETDMTEGARSWDKLRDTVVHRTPARRWGRPEDFEGVAVYLASRASDFHTGDTLRVDGGYAVF